MRTLPALLLILSACGHQEIFLTLPLAPPARCVEISGWKKVETHTHTTNSDGDSSPSVVAKWYKDSCFDTIIITDHNYVTYEDQEGLEVIAGEEMSTIEDPHTHHVAVDNEKIIFNHPLAYSFNDKEDMLADTTSLFEVWNEGTQSLSNSSVLEEEAWDYVLANGKLMYGVAASDNHYLKTSEVHAGEAFIMVRDSGMATIEAIKAGDFYASTGVYLSEYTPDSLNYTMSVDYSATKADICITEIITAGNYTRGKVSCSYGSDTLYAWGQPVAMN